MPYWSAYLAMPDHVQHIRMHIDVISCSAAGTFAPSTDSHCRVPVEGTFARCVEDKITALQTFS